MKSEPTTHRLEDLARTYSERHLSINPEYQRGATWNIRQQRSLIDSILRGFILPIFYVHIKRTPNLFTKSETVTAWLVDGQQRLNAITEFMKGRFALSDPSTAGGGLAMAYERRNPPRWAGRKFDELIPEDRKQFLEHPLTVVRMEEEAPNEVRDLFIRLQSGTPLNPQEKRDAWPGDFTLFVIKHAGKDGHPVSSPHPFFDLVKHAASRASDDDDGVYVDRRSNTRKFFAGLAMTYLVRQDSELDFVDLKASNLDAFYLNKTDLPSDNPGVERLLRLLGEITRLPDIHRIRDGNKVKFQWAFHLVLLIDSMIAADYVEASWRGKVIEAFEQFREECALASRAFKERGERSPHYNDFVQPLSGSGSDTAEKIRLRHRFLLQAILRLLKPQPKDPLRLFGPIEREIMWYRQQGKCAHPDCQRQTPLAEMQAHHIREHTKGGLTTAENGVLLCRSCHQDRAQLQSLESFLLAQIQAAERSTPTAGADDLDDEIGTVPQKLKVEINWPALGKGPESQVLHYPVETDTVVAFCERLIEMFGEEAVRWMTDRAITRYPISMHPLTTFKNPVSGNVYSHRAISGTSFYVCTHSSHPEKVRRLQSWAAGLPDPINAAITVGVGCLPAGG
jgi:hypothetical protein